MAEVKEAGRAPAEFWKWTSAVLVSIMLSMAGYIVTVEGAIRDAVAEEVGMSVKVLQERQVTVSELIRAEREARIQDEARIREMEASYREIRSTLSNIQQNQARILQRLGNP